MSRRREEDGFTLVLSLSLSWNLFFFSFLVVSSLLSVICVFSVTLSFYVRWSWGMLFSWMWRCVCSLYLQVSKFLKSVATVSPTYAASLSGRFIQVHLPIILFRFDIICCFHRRCSRLMYPLEVRASYTRLYPDFYLLLFIKGGLW